MAAFGWTIEYTLALPWPVFMDLFGLIRRVRLDNAIDAVFTPYCAGKYGGNIARDMFSERGSFFLDPQPAQVDKESLEKAHLRLHNIILAREKQLASAVIN